MFSRPITIVLFIILVAAQLYIPGKMIFHREDVLRSGKAFKFRSAPVDPYDALRGKYIHLDFQEEFNYLKLDSADGWNPGDQVYIVLGTDSAGFVTFEEGLKDPPEGKDYLLTTLEWYYDYENEWTVEIPFNRFYMEESIAYDAELAYRESNIDSASISYALVMIKDGEAVLKNVFINDKPISEVARERLKK